MLIINLMNFPAKKFILFLLQIVAYQEEINRLSIYIEQRKAAATHETLNDQELKEYIQAVGQHHLLQLWINKLKAGMGNFEL